MLETVENWLNSFGVLSGRDEIYSYGMYLVDDTIWICSPELVTLMGTDNSIPEDYLEVEEAFDLITEDNYGYEIKC